MKMQSFEIRVALLGYVSAGKSTVLNALLQNKCSEVAMRRTTAGVNLFRVYPKGAPSKATDASDKVAWNPDPEVVHTPPQVLSQISSDNKELRSVNTVQETTFNVELDEPICDMRQDTTLVLLDIPGLNEAGSKDVYFEYVMEKWDTFDCVIVVMDVFQGVNTDEQVKLLEIVHQNKEIKDIPIIVLCNKVDDPDNKEVIGLVEEISQKVHSIFQDTQPVNFIPISAENAFVYRTASQLSFHEFKQLDESLVDKIVYEEVGKANWRKLSVAERYQTAYDGVGNPSSLEESLKATNFHKFLEVFSRCVGEPAQPALIQKQLVVELKTISFHNLVADKLKKHHDTEDWLGVPPLNPSEHFWVIYDKFHGTYIDAFVKEMDHRSLQVVMSQLVAFGTLLHSLGRATSAEMARVVETMSSLVVKQVRWIIEHSGKSTWLTNSTAVTQQILDWYCDCYYDAANPGNEAYFYNINTLADSKPPTGKPPDSDCAHHWKQTEQRWENIYTDVVVEGEHNPVTGKLTWTNVSPLDFVTMARSILLLSYSKSFNVRLGHVKFALEKALGEIDVKLKAVTEPRVQTILSVFTKCTYNGKDELVPMYPDKYAMVVQIAQPTFVSDPNHWGHLAWQFCEFVDGLSGVLEEK